MLGFQECCDAVNYADIGQVCLVRGWASCWSDFRALGAILLNALMHPYGLAPLSHILLLFFSILLLTNNKQQHNPSQEFNLANILAKRHDKKAIIKAQKYILNILGVFLLIEFMFVGLASVNLTDVPAGIFAALAIIGFYRKNAIIFALAAGVSVLIRAAYLYPMLVLVAYFIFESIYQKAYSKAAICAMFFVCLAPQYWLTYQHLGVFSFLDPVKVEFWRNIHFSSNWAGYDTLLPGAAYPWQSGVPLGLSAAIEQRHWGELLKLFLSRIDFYFASFVPFGKVYLSSPSERIFSPVILLLHCLAFVFSYLYLKAKQSAWRVWFPLFIIMVQSLLIVPEQRFIFIIQLFLVILTYLYFLRNIEKQRPNLEYLI